MLRETASVDSYAVIVMRNYFLFHAFVTAFAITPISPTLASLTFLAFGLCFVLLARQENR